MARRHTKIDRRRWNLLRRQVFNRDGYRCRKCGSAGRLECDHVISLDRGGDPYDPDNLQALCRGCHIEKTRRENAEKFDARSPQAAIWRRGVEELL